MRQGRAARNVGKKMGTGDKFQGLLAFQGHHGGVHISAAKVGVIGFTRALSTELAPAGILVNCIVPGAIDTIREGGQQPRVNPRVAEIPVGRTGQPSEIAALCAFLCSDEAEFITGQTFHVNGGERAF